MWLARGRSYDLVVRTEQAFLSPEAIERVLRDVGFSPVRVARAGDSVSPALAQASSVFHATYPQSIGFAVGSWAREPREQREDAGEVTILAAMPSTSVAPPTEPTRVSLMPPWAWGLVAASVLATIGAQLIVNRRSRS